MWAARELTAGTHTNWGNIMTWHTSTTTRDRLERLIKDIRENGGTIASCQRCTTGLLVTWFTL